MNILISSNDRYIMPLTVLLQSIFDHCAAPINFYFLMADLSTDNQKHLQEYVEQHQAQITFIPVGDTDFASLPVKNYISRETYFRILADEYLPEKVHKVLWLDADMIVTGDISALYETELGELAVAACPHGAAMQPTILENCKTIGISVPEQYFNAGMMLCNLDAWRKMDIRKRVQDALSVPHTYAFPGQDLTNLVFNGSVITLDWQLYNCMTHSITQENMPYLREHAKIIHFVGPAKPWQFHDLPFADDWMNYYLESPYGGQSLKRTSYFRMKALYERMGKAIG